MPGPSGFAPKPPRCLFDLVRDEHRRFQQLGYKCRQQEHEIRWLRGLLAERGIDPGAAPPSRERRGPRDRRPQATEGMLEIPSSTQQHAQEAPPAAPVTDARPAASPPAPRNAKRSAGANDKTDNGRQLRPRLPSPDPHGSTVSPGPATCGLQGVKYPPSASPSSSAAAGAPAPKIAVEERKTADLASSASSLAAAAAQHAEQAAPEEVRAGMPIDAASPALASPQMVVVASPSFHPGAPRPTKSQRKRPPLPRGRID